MLQQEQIPCDVPCLAHRFAKSIPYDDPFFLKCLGLLAITAMEPKSNVSLSRPIVMLRRHRLLVDVQAAVYENYGTNIALAPVIALVAGWEMVRY